MNTFDKNQLIEKAGKVAVLMGGTSAEREISLLGGNLVLESLKKAGFHVVGIDARDDLIMQLQQSKPDRVFNMLHGRGGEDGTIQGLLQYFNIPYTGSGVLGSALSMDKLKTKLIWRNLGLATADFEVLSARSDWLSVIDRLGPVVVKPVSEGSSIGMSIAANKIPGIRAALVWDEFTAQMSRAHNNSNVMCLGERVINQHRAADFVKIWLETEFEGCRHQDRIQCIDL